MLSSVLLMVLTQFAACTPGETSFVCNCKAGMVTACMTLVGQNARRAAQVLQEVEEALAELDELEHASRMEGKQDEKTKRKRQELQTAAESLTQSLGPSKLLDCKGQEHHIISRRIADALSRHPTLKGHFKHRDPRFVAVSVKVVVVSK